MSRAGFRLDYAGIMRFFNQDNVAALVYKHAEDVAAAASSQVKSTPGMRNAPFTAHRGVASKVAISNVAISNPDGMRAQARGHVLQKAAKL